MSGNMLTDAANIVKTGRNWRITAQNFDCNNRGLARGWQEAVNKKTGAKRISLIENGKPITAVTIDGNKVYHTQPDGSRTLIEYGSDGKPFSALYKSKFFKEIVTDPLKLWFHSSEALEKNAFLRDCITKDYGINKFQALG